MDGVPSEKMSLIIHIFIALIVTGPGINDGVRTLGRVSYENPQLHTQSVQRVWKRKDYADQHFGMREGLHKWRVPTPDRD